jgi:hypothetical protein
MRMLSLVPGAAATLLALLGCGTDPERASPGSPAAPGPLSESACGEPAEGLRVSMGVIGPPDATTYDGPVIVERSTATQLLLAFGEGELVRRAGVSAYPALPLFPVGARLWLTTVPTAQPRPQGFVHETSSAWTLRDRQDGTILMGASWQAPSDPAAPVTARAGADTCVADHPYCSSPDAAIYRQAVEVFADETELFADGEVRTISIDGKSYRARATASRETGSVCPADYYPSLETRLSLWVVAEDLTALLADVDVGEPPACGQGNDPHTDIDIAIYYASSSDYEGPVFYRSLGPDLADTFMFEIPGLGSAAEPALLGIMAASHAFTAPAVGAEFWAEVDLDHAFAALRESEQGPLVVASGAGVEVPFDGQTAQRIERAVGVGVHAEPRCQYVARTAFSDEPYFLWDLVFDTDPPTRVGSGETGSLVIAGRPYEVSVTSVESIVQFSIFRR